MAHAAGHGRDGDDGDGSHDGHGRVSNVGDGHAHDDHQDDDQDDDQDDHDDHLEDADEHDDHSHELDDHDGDVVEHEGGLLRGQHLLGAARHGPDEGVPGGRHLRVPGQVPEDGGLQALLVLEARQGLPPPGRLRAAAEAQVRLRLRAVPVLEQHPGPRPVHEVRRLHVSLPHVRVPGVGHHVCSDPGRAQGVLGEHRPLGRHRAVPGVVRGHGRLRALHRRVPPGVQLGWR
mmetsp:Transcript_17685/g.50094  ORF Transcript_17685/g.50094 Transcript_17685/m.50094 type:complete len:232 (-) Transcript_17685:628-1323(-)